MTNNPEQPKSLDQIMNEANSESVRGLFDTGMALGLGMLASRYRMEGRPKIADKVDEIAVKIEGRRIASNIRGFLEDAGIEIIEGEIVDTEQDPDQITDKI